MKDTTPIFIVGSGRNGTRSIYKLLTGILHLEVYHEYECTHIQPIAAKYYMGILSKNEAKKAIMKLHGGAIFYSKARYFVDSSNKLSWIIEPLYELFPKAKFIHIIRDGRKVTSSFFHKLAPEIYDDDSVKVMQNWLYHPQKFPEPPPEKKYWWNIPQKGQPYFKEFASFNQFQRICYHWSEIIRVITESFKKIPKKQQLTVKLEELTAKKNILKNFLSFFDVVYEKHFFEFLQTPQNVFFPMDLKPTVEEINKFNAICGKTMTKLGYSRKKVYDVTY